MGGGEPELIVDLAAGRRLAVEGGAVPRGDAFQIGGRQVGVGEGRFRGEVICPRGLHGLWRPRFHGGELIRGEPIRGEPIRVLP